MRSIVLILLFLTSPMLGKGQGIITSMIAERTVAGYEAGASMQYETQGLWRLGAFYQISLSDNVEGLSTENRFYGIAVAAALIKSGKINFFGVLRPGLVGDKYIVVVPAVETEIRPSKHFSYGVGASIRKTLPALYLRINYTL